MINVEQEQRYFLQAIRDRKLSTGTQRKYSDNLGKFLEWMNGEKLKLQHLQYNDLLDFVKHCKQNQTSTDKINRTIQILQQYFTIKVKAQAIKKNLAIGLKVRGTTKRLPHDLLDRKALDKLYDHYPSHSNNDKRNKTILGLLVHQGLTSGDLQRLKSEHVKLKEGKIYIPGSPQYVHRGGINNRMLELKANQLFELKEYIEQVRPQMTDEFTEQLFMSERGSTKLNNVLNELSRKLRKIEKDYKNVDQLRASVITEWLKEKDVRIVQYMSGHKNVKSTEHYKAVRLEDLQHALDQFHPLK
jgi:integrase/recombinase XerD